jgi:hypothetical protein
MACPREKTCPLFEQRAIQASLSVWRSYYCDCDHVRCERFKLAASGAGVPDNLLPNGRLLDLPLPPFERPAAF